MPNELDPKDLEKLTLELTKYAEEGASDEDMRVFRESYISEIKKKSTKNTPTSPSLSDIGQPFTSTVQTPLVKPSPLVSNLKSVSETKEKQINPFTAKSESNPFAVNKVSEYSPFTATIEDVNKKEEEVRLGKITQQQLDDNPRYQYLLNKKEAYERGYKDEKGLNGKTAEQQLFEDREPYLINKLNPKEQEEVKSLANYQSLMKIGKEKEAQDELQKYLNARSEWRKEIDDQIVEIKATLPNITDPTELQLAKRDIAELEIQKKPIYDPKAAMSEILDENSKEVAQIAKPTETPKEQLRKYTNSLYGSVLRQKERLGIAEELNGMDRFLAERELYSQNKGAELEKLHQDELKLKNAIKIYELNRTPYEKDTALGVFAKTFVGEVVPYTKSKIGLDNTIAGNIQSIVQDANITDATNKEQLDLAKQYGDKYEFLSSKWVSQNLAPTAAIMTEMIPAAILTEGAFAVSGLGKLNKAITLLSERGSLGKASKFYFNALQNNKYGRGLIKSAFSGLKYGIESEAAAQLAPQIKDEMGFANGLFAGAVGKALGGLSGKILEKSLSSVGRLFGNQTPNAIRAIETYGKLISKAKDFSDKVVGETAEEYAEQLVGIYKQSDGYKSFIDNLNKHYETTDALEEFATILMMSVGAPAGSTLASSLFSTSKKMYNTMNRAERRIASQMADEIHSENRQALEQSVEETAVAEKIDLRQPEINIKLPTLEVATPPNPFNKELEKLGYAKNDIDKMSFEQKQEIVTNKTEAPIVESSAKVDVIKENAKQERFAELNAELDKEIINEPTAEVQPIAETSNKEETPQENQTTTTPSSSNNSEVSAPSVIENKKADIEKRRQEEFDQYANDIIVKTELYEDGEGRKYLIHTLKNGKKRLDAANEEGKRTSTLYVYESSVPVENYITDAKKIKDIEKTPSKQENRINAKYDEELAALEKISNKPNDTNTEKQLPTSNKGTQTTEPTKQESEAKVEEKKEVVDPEIQRRDNLVTDLSTYNKLTKAAKASSKGVKMLNGIKTRATEMGFTTRENKGKFEVVKENGKKLTKSITKEEVAEPTQEARANFRKLFKEGVLTPSIVSETLEPTQIRVALEAFRNGKETKDVKRLMNEFANFNEDTNVNYRDYDQATGQWISNSVPLSEILTQEVDVDNLTEKEINELADIYDDMFANTDEETKNQITNLFYEEENRQQDKSQDSTSSKSSTKAKGTKTSEKVVKAVEKILENEFEANGSLSKDATIRTQKRNTAVKQVKSELDSKEAKAVETVIANYDKIRDILIDNKMIKAIDCKWVK